MSNAAKKYNIVIVGSGFSGIAAANILAGHGLSILLMDENLHIGGQLLRKIPDQLGEYSSYTPDYTKKIGFNFIKSLKEKKLEILNRASLVGIYDDKKLMVETREKEVFAIEYDTLLFATGARERFYPFKGWTLPGVYSAGMVQVMMKSSGILPARNIVIGGSGLFLFSVAHEFLKNKGKVAAVLEQTGMMDKVKLIPTLLHQLSKAVEGGKYLSRIYLSGTPVRYRKKIIEARGNGCLEELVVGKVDGNGKLVTGSEKIYKTEALGLGYGFVPNVEGPQLAGCQLEYSVGKGGWVVKVEDNLTTSVADILAAGEITGVGGAFKSITEGQIAAYTILNQLGKLENSEYNTVMKKLTTKRKHQLQFTEYFNSLYRPPVNALLEVPDETVVCRCESVTMGDIKQSVALGCTDANSLKMGVRTAMGNCQGRTCGPIIYDIMSCLTQKQPENAGTFSARPPLKPLSIGSLLNYK
ncbi:MAG: NAD(P)/FAD-dependent oxidoreductase [bacterium]|nr:NAD(P)/FAD-dependent oxidoreductase [bacterium]